MHLSSQLSPQDVLHVGLEEAGRQATPAVKRLRGGLEGHRPRPWGGARDRARKGRGLARGGRTRKGHLDPVSGVWVAGGLLLITPGPSASRTLGLFGSLEKAVRT